MLPDKIVLIEPFRAWSGKPVIARLLAERFNRSFFSTLEFQLEDYVALGYDMVEGGRVWSQEGPIPFYRYAMPYQSRLVINKLAEPGEAVVDLQTEYIVMEEAELQAEVNRAFEPLPGVVLLLPTADLEKNLHAMRENLLGISRSFIELNYFFVDHPSNSRLAKHTVYTKDCTPEHTADEIIAKLDLSQPSPVILIGPVRTGKTTLGTILADKLKKPNVSLDALRWDYYKEIGYNEDEANRIRTEQGAFGIFRYWQPFHAHAVERVLQDYPDGIIDFGGGHSVYEDPALLERVVNLLAPYPNIVLIVPSPDLEESKEILEQRMKEEAVAMGDLLEKLARNPSLYKLAKHTLFTEGLSPEETCDEIVKKLSNDLN